MNRFVLIAGGAIIIPTMPVLASGSVATTSHSAKPALLKVKAGTTLNASANLKATLGSGSTGHAVAPKGTGGRLLNVTVGKGAVHGTRPLVNAKVGTLTSRKGGISTGNLGATGKGSLVNVSVLGNNRAKQRGVVNVSVLGSNPAKQRGLVNVSVLDSNRGPKASRPTRPTTGPATGPTARPNRPVTRDVDRNWTGRTPSDRKGPWRPWAQANRDNRGGLIVRPLPPASKTPRQVDRAGGFTWKGKVHRPNSPPTATGNGTDGRTARWKGHHRPRGNNGGSTNNGSGGNGYGNYNGSLVNVSILNGKSAKRTTTTRSPRGGQPLVNVSALNAKGGKSGSLVNVSALNGTATKGKSAVNVAALNGSKGSPGQLVNVSLLNKRK